MLSENSKTSCIYNIIPIFIKIIYIRLYLHRKKRIPYSNSGYLLMMRLWVILLKKIYHILQIFYNEHILHLLSDKSYAFPPVKDIQQMEGGDHNQGWI